MSGTHSITLALRAAAVCALACTLVPIASCRAFAQEPPASAVLVELFTSEGCSSCPPADELLRQLNQQKTSSGQLIIGLSEHVSYWNGLGWRDPFSSEQFTGRQNQYSAKFQTEGPYTPQMVVNGREQFVGSDSRKLHEALSSEGKRKQIALHIEHANVAGTEIMFSYSARNLPSDASLELMAAIVDDSDRSSVSRGENSGRVLQHVFVVRALVMVATLHGAGVASSPVISARLPLPPGFQPAQGHHLVLFAQEKGLGAVLGVDAKPLF